MIAGRIIWRRLADRDRALYVALYTDLETMRYIAPPLTVAIAQRSFAAALSSPAPVRRYALDHANEPIGLGLIDASAGPRAPIEIGLLLRADRRGIGIGSAALAALVARAQRGQDREPVSVQFARHHPTAGRLVASVGFAVVGPGHETGFVRADYQRVVLAQCCSTVRKGDLHVEFDPDA